MIYSEFNDDESEYTTPTTPSNPSSTAYHDKISKYKNRRKIIKDSAVQSKTFLTTNEHKSDQEISNLDNVGDETTFRKVEKFIAQEGQHQQMDIKSKHFYHKI